MLEGLFFEGQNFDIFGLLDHFLKDCTMNEGHFCFQVFMTLQKGQEKVMIKTTGLVHNFIIPSNCWNHDWMSKSNGSMSYGVHKKVFRTPGWTVGITRSQ